MGIAKKPCVVYRDREVPANEEHLACVGATNHALNNVLSVSDNIMPTGARMTFTRCPLAFSHLRFVAMIRNAIFFRDCPACALPTTITMLQSHGLLGDVCKGCDAECEDCSTVPEALKCSEAMDHTSSPGGSTTLDALILDGGYWRASGGSRKVLACYNADACRGGVTGAPSYCSRGYSGPCEGF